MERSRKTDLENSTEVIRDEIEAVCAEYECETRGEKFERLAGRIHRLQRRNSDLQRRCQQAEAAVKKFVEQWNAAGGPKGGSFGRALLACECVRLQALLDRGAGDGVGGG